MHEILKAFKRAKLLSKLSGDELVDEFLACSEWDTNLRDVTQSPAMLEMTSQELRKYREQIHKNWAHQEEIIKEIISKPNERCRHLGKIFTAGNMPAKIRIVDVYFDRCPDDSIEQISNLIDKLGADNMYTDRLRSVLGRD